MGSDSYSQRDDQLDLEVLPGADLVKRGVEDLDGGRESAEALARIDWRPPAAIDRHRAVLADPLPEHKLYLLLAKEKGDAAHSAYNALIRRSVSFERTAACSELADSTSTSSSSQTAMRSCESQDQFRDQIPGLTSAMACLSPR